MEDNKFQDLMALTHVPRWAIIPLTKSQSVAEHTYRVMVISSNLVDALNATGTLVDSLTVLKWAMDHDGTESKTGDLPTPFKHINYDQVEKQAMVACPWYSSSISYTDELSRNIVGVADTIEALMYIKVYGTNRNVEQEIIDDMRCRIAVELYRFNGSPVNRFNNMIKKAKAILKQVDIFLPDVTESLLNKYKPKRK